MLVSMHSCCVCVQIDAFLLSSHSEITHTCTHACMHAHTHANTHAHTLLLPYCITQLLLRYRLYINLLSILLFFETPVDMVLNALGSKQTLTMQTWHTAQDGMPLAMVVNKTKSVVGCEGPPLTRHTVVSTASAACCSCLFLLSSFIPSLVSYTMFLAKASSSTSCCHTLQSSAF